MTDEEPGGEEDKKGRERGDRGKGSDKECESVSVSVSVSESEGVSEIAQVEEGHFPSAPLRTQLKMSLSWAVAVCYISLYPRVTANLRCPGLLLPCRSPIALSKSVSSWVASGQVNRNQATHSVREG